VSFVVKKNHITNSRPLYAFTPLCLYAFMPLRPLTTVAFIDQRSFSEGGGEGGFISYLALYF
jgi:hypothetical protein